MMAGSLILQAAQETVTTILEEFQDNPELVKTVTLMTNAFHDKAVEMNAPYMAGLVTVANIIGRLGDECAEDSEGEMTEEEARIMFLSVIKMLGDVRIAILAKDDDDEQ